jgi:hypothetical protein
MTHGCAQGLGQLGSVISWWTFPTRSTRSVAPTCGEGFRELLAEVTEAFEKASDPGPLWAKWIDVVVERTSA